MSSLSQDEIDALVSQLSAPETRADDESAEKRIKAFDFRFNKRLDKFSNNQLQTLRTLHENFTRLLNNSLSVYLRTRVEASILSIDQISYGDFVSSIGTPSILAIYSMEPLPGSGVVQLDLNLTFAVIDRLLGGPGWYPNKLRDLTDIERTLMQRFMARMFNSYRESWNYLLTLSLKIEALDSNPQFIPRIIPLDRIVAYVSMELKVGDMSGIMNFCLPYLVLQSVSSQLTEFQWSPTVNQNGGTTPEDVAGLARNVERASVDLRVELGRTNISVRDLAGLREGDVLVFDRPAAQPLAATINDRQKFRVYPGVHRERLAAQVAEVLSA